MSLERENSNETGSLSVGSVMKILGNFHVFGVGDQNA